MRRLDEVGGELRWRRNERELREAVFEGQMLYPSGNI